MPIPPEFLHLKYPGPFDAYLYGRASRDPKKKGRSVADQMAENRALCELHGWPVAAEFKDLDRSASRHAKKSRDEFEAMIAGIEAGHCRILVTWEASRFSRDLDIYVRLRSVCMTAGVLWCYNGTVYDLSKGEDRKATARDALESEGEAEAIRERNLRTARQFAEKGKPHGPILYGYARRYDPDTGDLIDQIEHPDRAAIAEDIFDRVAAGEALGAVAKSLAEKKILTRFDKPWTTSSLRVMLRNPAYMGRRMHHGREVCDATWPAIVEEETFRAVQRVLDAPDRKPKRDNKVRHLLSGIAVCGEHPDEPALRPIRHSRGHDAYRCPTRFDVQVHALRLQAYVEEAVIEWLKSDAAAHAFHNEEDRSQAAAARLRLERLNAQLREARKSAARFKADGTPELSIASLSALEESLTPQIEKADAESQTPAVPPLLRDLAGRPDADARWDSLHITQQRMILRMIVRIRVFQARATGVKSIAPGRVVLAFVGEPGFRKDG